MPCYLKNYETNNTVWKFKVISIDRYTLIEPAHEIMPLFFPRKLILQTRMSNQPVGLDVWFLVGPFGRLAWAFAGCLCDKYHNVMSWLNLRFFSQKLWYVHFPNLCNAWIVCTAYDLESSFALVLFLRTVMILSFRTDMPGQTVQTQIRLLLGAVWSGSTLFAIPSASFGLNTLWQSRIVQILEWLQQIFWVSEYLGNLRYLHLKQIKRSLQYY